MSAEVEYAEIRVRVTPDGGMLAEDLASVLATLIENQGKLIQQVSNLREALARIAPEQLGAQAPRRVLAREGP